MFEAEVTELIEFYSSRHRPLPPTFAFVDPFGWTGVPFSLLAQIIGHPSCEVLVNFMYEEINRFLTQSDQPENFDSFFGTREWRGMRQRFAPTAEPLPARPLRATTSPCSGSDVCALVRDEERGRRNRLLLVLCHEEPEGLQKMKEAMWKVDPKGEFKFSDATDPSQMIMLATHR